MADFDSHITCMRNFLNLIFFFKKCWLLLIVPFFVQAKCFNDSTELNPLSASPQNGQTHLNNSSATTDEFFECV